MYPEVIGNEGATPVYGKETRRSLCIKGRELLIL